MNADLAVACRHPRHFRLFTEGNSTAESADSELELDFSDALRTFHYDQFDLLSIRCYQSHQVALSEIRKAYKGCFQELMVISRRHAIVETNPGGSVQVPNYHISTSFREYRGLHWQSQVTFILSNV